MPSWSSRLLHTNTAPGSSQSANLHSNPQPLTSPKRPDSRNRTRAQGSVPDPAADLSTSFPTLYPPRPPPQQDRYSPQKGRQHARSISHPFPSLFGYGRKKSTGNLNVEGLDSTDDDGPVANMKAGAGRRGNAKRMDDRDIETGNCMTCDSKVKWPRGLKVFRCAACLTINDLEPISQDPERRSCSRTREQPRSHPGPAPYKKVLPLSVERTQAIVDRCVVTYLQSRYEGKIRPHSPQKAGQALGSRRNPPNANGGMEDPPASALDNRGAVSGPIPLGQTMTAAAPSNDASSANGHGFPQSTTVESGVLSTSPSKYLQQLPSDRPGPISHVPPRPTRNPPPPPIQSQDPSNQTVSKQPLPADQLQEYQPRQSPRLTPEDLEEKRRHESVKAIFRPLEDYLISAIGSFECVNTSFMTGRPLGSVRTRSEGSVSLPAPPDPATDLAFSGGLISELDAKMLLLGDVAENGSWWSGRAERKGSQGRPTRRERSVDTSKQLVNHRSPRINWSEVARWYETVLTAGQSWRGKVREVGDDAFRASFGDEMSTDAQEAEDDMMEARHHLQRALLKITENLLKRPGRPLKEADDTRFLLILLFNPLLYPPGTFKFSSEVNRPVAKPRKSSAVVIGNVLQVPQTRNVPSPQRSPERRNREFGQHSGIIKRVLGLLANLPNECHRSLVTWLSKFGEDHFQRTVDLVASFVTHRLTRQQARKRSNSLRPTSGLIPEFSGPGTATSAQLHAALGLPSSGGRSDENGAQGAVYGDDWQLKAAAKVMALLFAANNIFYSRRSDAKSSNNSVCGTLSAGPAAKQKARSHGHLLATSEFYNTLLDYSDLIADFEAWESRRGRFSFCQYPFFLSIGAKIRILEYDAKRQMDSKAREAFFDSILRNANLEQYFHLRVRRDCLVEDSLRRISESVGSGQEEIKKGLKVQFVGEEGVDAGGLRKEWFLLLVRELFDPNHGMFVYDEDSQLCYFNPNSFETSDQYFLVGAVLGLAIYNSTILDVALPPFAFKKLLSSAPAQNSSVHSFMKVPVYYTLEDLAEYRPVLARGLRQLLEYEGDVEETFCRDFVAEVERYGSVTQVPLCPGGENRPVTNENRQEFVDLYVRYILDTAVARQFEPFKRGFFTVCGGNALSLFRPEEIELLIRGSDEPLDVASLQAVAVYDGWKDGDKPVEKPGETVSVIRWFWELFDVANPQDQRRILSFITGSDRIPAVGATNLVIKIAYLGEDCDRFPVARTCFNVLQLYRYRSRERLVQKLWRAVTESEGFGLK